MEYISNVVIEDGESERVHPFPTHKQQEEFWRWWKNLQPPPPQNLTANPYVKFTFKFLRQNCKTN